MPSRFVIWKSRPIPHGCSVTELHGVERVFLLNKGYSALASFPKKAEFRFDPDFPRNTVLADNLINSEMMIVCSERLKIFLEASLVEKVEYLPVHLKDHKSKQVAQFYYIIHPIEPPDCIDFEQSIVEWSGVDKESILLVKKLVIDDSKVENNRLLFRPKSFYNITLIDRDLAVAIDGQGVTGVGWIELEDYPFPRPRQ